MKSPAHQTYLDYKDGSRKPLYSSITTAEDCVRWINESIDMIQRMHRKQLCFFKVYSNPKPLELSQGYQSFADEVKKKLT